MKVRTLEDLERRLSDELAWRKQELGSFHLVTDGLYRAGKRTDMQAVLRGAIALLYAHWEGYVKESTYLYLSFVSSKRIPIDQLSCAIAPAIAGQYTDDLLSKGSIPSITEFARIMRGSGESMKRLSVKKNQIDTGSNLNFRLFIRLSEAAGLPTEGFLENESLANLIDEQLLARRNKIAHGEHNFVDYNEYYEVRDGVLEAIDDFTNIVLIAASTERFLARNHP